MGVKWKSEFTSRMERKASCCRVLIKASFSKFNDSPSNGFWLVTVSSVIAVDHKKKLIKTPDNCSLFMLEQKS